MICTGMEPRGESEEVRCECGRQVLARGLCQRCYQAHWRAKKRLNRPAAKKIAKPKRTPAPPVIRYRGEIRCGDVAGQLFVWADHGDVIEMRGYGDVNDPTIQFLTEDALRGFAAYTPNPEGTLVRRKL